MLNFVALVALEPNVWEELVLVHPTDWSTAFIAESLPDCTPRQCVIQSHVAIALFTSLRALTTWDTPIRNSSCVIEFMWQSLPTNIFPNLTKI